MNLCFFFSYKVVIFGLKLDWRLVDEAVTEDCSDHERDLEYRKSVTCRVFMGFTSNLISFGVRDIVRFLLHHRVTFPCSEANSSLSNGILQCFSPS